MGRFLEAIREELEGLPETGPDDNPYDTIGADYDSNAAVVQKVQAAINALGYSPPLATDGSYGPLTAAGVKWLQAQKGLSQDGVIGDQTLGALGLAPGAPVPPQPKGKPTATAAPSALQATFAPLIAWAITEPQPLTQGKGVAPGFQATRASVVNSFVPWTTPLEGFLPFMYIDGLGYVTTGMGNLIDPISSALALPWKHADGSPASAAEITAAWNAVDGLRTAPKGQKQPSGPAVNGGGTQGGYTSIRVTKADVQKLVADKMRANEDYMLSHGLALAPAPADAQLAAHSMSWAMGPGFASTWTQFRDAFNKGDYATAADQSHMQGVGIDMRNLANKLLLTNAAQVRARGYSSDTLYYLNGLSQLFTTSPLAMFASIMRNKKRTVGIFAGVFAVIGLIVAFALRQGPRHPALPPRKDIS